MSDFAANAYQIESTPPGLMRGGLAPGAVCNYSLIPLIYESGETGVYVDFTSGSGMAFAIASVVAVSADNPINIILEESNDIITWTNVTGGAFPAVTQGQELTMILNFQRTKRYVRASFVFTTLLSANICAIIGKQ